MKVSEFMTQNVVCCKEDQTVLVVAEMMQEHGYSALPVVNAKGELVGIITISDFVGQKKTIPHVMALTKELLGQLFYFRDVEEIYLQSKEVLVKKVMSRKLRVLHRDTLLTDAINYMIRKNMRRFPVVEEGTNKLVGIVTRKDILRGYLRVLRSS